MSSPKSEWIVFKPLVCKYIGVMDIDTYDSWEKLAVDSLDKVELVMMVEEEYGVEFTDREVADTKTIGELHRLLVRTIEWGRVVGITHRDTNHTMVSPQQYPEHCPHCGRR